MSHNLTLYWGSGSPFAWRVMILLLESGLQFNSKLLSFSNREHKSEEFLKINPLGKVPALTDGDVKVHESLAIIHYLQITYPNETAKLFGGSNGKDRADALIKYHEFNSYLAQQGSDVGSHLWRKTGELAHVYKQFQALITELKRWDGFLANATYFAGENFTVADCIVIPLLYALERQGLRFKDHGLDRIQTYVDRERTRPSVAGAMPPHWAENPVQTNLMDEFLERAKQLPQ